MATEMLSNVETISPPDSPQKDTVSTLEKAVLLLYFISVAVLLMYFLIRLWPDHPPSGGTTWDKRVYVFWKPGAIAYVSDDVRLLLLVVMAGGLGSFIHAATSFVDYVGNRRFVRSWLLWYMMRPLIGSALAVVLYVAVRGGLLNPAAGSESVSPFGVVAVASLAGMFSKQATDKLNEVFCTLFKTTEGDAARKDKLDTSPKVIAVQPSQLHTGTDADLIVSGSGFESASIVRLNGQAKPTTFISATRLTVKIGKNDVTAAGTLALTVHNTSGQSSVPVSVTVV
jgi:hypothetical protein